MSHRWTTNHMIPSYTNSSRVSSIPLKTQDSGVAVVSLNIDLTRTCTALFLRICLHVTCTAYSVYCTIYTILRIYDVHCTVYTMYPAYTVHSTYLIWPTTHSITRQIWIMIMWHHKNYHILYIMQYIYIYIHTHTNTCTHAYRTLCTWYTRHD